MRLAVINDTDGRENIGCRLTSSRFKASLLERAAEAGSDLQVIPCPWKFRKSSEPVMPHTAFALMGGSSVLSDRVLREMSLAEYGAQAVADVESADVALYHPEGSISDDNNAFRVFRQLCLPLYAHVSLRKPLVIANGTFPRFGDHRKDLLLSLVAGAEAAFFRDRLSTEHYGGRFCPDAAITWRGAPVDADAAQREYALVTTAAHASVEDDRALCRRALDFCRANGVRPMVLTKGWERLAGFRDEVTAAGGRFLTYATLDEAEALLQDVRFHVGGRYHMAIFCLTKGIPSWLVVSNTHKNRWLAEDCHGVELLPSAHADLGAAIQLSRLPQPSAILQSVAVQVGLFEQESRTLFAAIAAAAGGRAKAPDAASAAWDRANVRAALRNDYFRDATKVVLRSLGVMRPPRHHELPT